MGEHSGRSVSRRGMIAGAAGALLLAGCSAGRAASASGSGPSPAPGAAAAPTRPTAGTPRAEASGSSAPASVILARSQVPVLCFHQIREWTGGDSPSARTIITPPRRFANQMAALAKAGYTSITPEQLLAYLRFGRALPARPVLLTFDDASAGQYTQALPVLQRHRFTATFFIMTVVLDQPQWLSRAQVRDLHRRGMTIASHTWDHHPVTRYSGQDWRIQLVEPARELAQLTGAPVRLFAYPYGEWNQAALPHVRAAGYAAAFQLSDRQDPKEPLLTIRRMIAASDWDGPTLVARLEIGVRSGGR
jgi:peptidoglycan/xylan/chitin deacetylase (PgdA/CDA1 family)